MCQVGVGLRLEEGRKGGDRAAFSGSFFLAGWGGGVPGLGGFWPGGGDRYWGGRQKPPARPAGRPKSARTARQDRPAGRPGRRNPPPRGARKVHEKSLLYFLKSAQS